MEKPLHMLRIRLAVFAVVLAGTLGHKAIAESSSYPSTDRLTVSELQTDKDGSYFVVSLESNEDITYCAYNMDLILPPGITVASDKYGLMIMMHKTGGLYPDDRDGYLHKLSSNYVNGKYKIICYSTSNAEFLAKGGALMYVYVDVSPWAKAGANDVRFESIKFVEKNETGHVPADGVAGTIAVSGENREVTVNIAAENKIGTCILPFDCTLGAGSTAYTVADNDGEYLYLDAVESMDAYKPYIIYSELGLAETFRGNADAEAYPGTAVVNVDGLCGAIAPVEVSEGYILQNKNTGDGPCFYRVGDTPYSIKAGKCYLAPVSGSQRLAPRFPDESGVGCVTVAPATTGAVYDLAGRKVENPVPGNIYIVDGKKVLKIN